ncbi:hypothetical protein [Cystobacter fuscus]|uniref:hypothetical protein n=1 Tax=Cystobacter fuscus TaxID=43 RepID=UPI002B2AC42A|nr:hypothetical protein F0U63_43555 [Cystobacter fuscus]
MRGPIRRILAGVVLVGLTACGVTEDEAVRLKDGQTLSIPGVPLEGCGSFGCLYEGQVCMEVFFEYGRSPAVCVFMDVCERLDCQTQKPGYKCTLFDGFPGQVKCIERDD